MELFYQFKFKSFIFCADFSFLDNIHEDFANESLH